MKKENVTRILDYYMSPDGALMFFKKDIERAFEEFFDGKPDFPPPLDAVGHFNEWFLFDFKLSTVETPLEYFYNKNPLRLSPEELIEYKDMQENVYDIFEVKDVYKNKGLSLYSVRSEKKYEVREKSATDDLHKGDLLVCRIIKIDDHYELAGGSSFVLQPGEKGVDTFTADETSEINPKIIFHALIAQNSESNFREDKIVDDDALLVSGSLDGRLSQEEDDDCAVCQLMRKTREEGRQPTREELERAMKEANGDKH